MFLIPKEPVNDIHFFIPHSVNLIFLIKKSILLWVIDFINLFKKPRLGLVDFFFYRLPVFYVLDFCLYLSFNY